MLAATIIICFQDRDFIHISGNTLGTPILIQRYIYTLTFYTYALTRMRALTPVSYTHLDVYKRQVLHKGRFSIKKINKNKNLAVVAY